MPPPLLNFTASLRAAPDIVTTTVFAGGAPTAGSSSSSSSSGHSSLPIAAIVGGLVAGVFLSLAAVGIWVWWGKSLEKKNRSQPRLRSALKNGGRSTPSVNASKHSLPRHHPAMASLSQKSVSFAPVPSPRTSEDSDSPQTPSPATSSDMSNSEDRNKGKQTPREHGATSPPNATWPRNSPVPPRSALRPPSSLRGQSTERAYAPARPSPLAHATHAPSSSTRTPPAPTPDAHDGLAPPRMLTTQSADRSSGVSAPSEYSQEGTASDLEPPVRMLRAPDGRLHPHRETDEPSRSASSSPAHENAPARARIR